MREGGMGCGERSLYFAEKAKSRRFIEMLATRPISGRTHEDSAILTEDRRHQKGLWNLRERLEALEGKTGILNAEEKRRLGAELLHAKAEYEHFIKEAKLHSPEVVQLIDVNVVPLCEIQQMLDPDVSLLEYYVTDNEAYAWTVTQDTVESFELQTSSSELRGIVEDLTPSQWAGRSILVSDLTSPMHGGNYDTNHTYRRANASIGEFNQRSRDLYDLIIAPLEHVITTDKLLIVPHGPLHRAPFSALHDGEEYAIDKHSISVIPAASMIEFISSRRNSNDRHFLGIANPVTRFGSLRHAETEVALISVLFSSSEVYVREDATEKLSRLRSPDVDIIHFACHGEFNDRVPLQSTLYLTRDDENDGLLQVHEIFGMNLGNANLVTLSACETGLCKVHGGDDLVGLSMGFIYAGTPSLLATLWGVDDESTACLIESFYREWLSGISIPEALRLAQISLRNNPSFSHPFYWAPFVLIGDWK